MQNNHSHRMTTQLHFIIIIIIIINKFSRNSSLKVEKKLY